MAVDAGTVAMLLKALRQAVVDPDPDASAIVAARHGAAAAAVVVVPDAEERSAIRHQQRRGVALVDGRGSLRYNDVPPGLHGDVD